MIDRNAMRTHRTQSGFYRTQRTDATSSRVLVVAAGASFALHGVLGVAVLSARVGASGNSDYWAAAPAWTSDLSFANAPISDAPPKLSPAALKSDALTPEAVKKLIEQQPKIEERTPPKLAQQEPEQKKEVEVRPGIDDSTSDSETWIGAARATEHSAHKASVDQAGLSMNPGSPGAPGGVSEEKNSATNAAEASVRATQADATSAQASQPRPENATRESGRASQRQQSQSATSQHESERSDAHLEHAASDVAEQIEEKELAKRAVQGQPEDAASKIYEQTARPLHEAPMRVILDELGVPIPQQTAENEHAKNQEPRQDWKIVAPRKFALGAYSPENTLVTTQDNDASDDADAANLQTPSPSNQQQQTPQAGTTTPTTPTTTQAGSGNGGNQRLPGELSDAESAATSKDDSVEYKPGKPLAGKGIRVRTVAARFAHTTQLTALPKNPRLTIKFNRMGRVVSVEFENKEGTGYADVDGPLRDSIFRWTASGKALTDLPTHDPQATVTMKIVYLFRDE